MNRNELVKFAYEIGFQRALLLSGLSKEAFDWSSLFSIFRKTGPKNIASGSYKKFQAEQAARRARGLKQKSTKDLISGGLNLQVRPMAQRMRPVRA